MAKDRLPADWDWVTARSECSVIKFYERLRLQATRDTEKRNSLPHEAGKCSLESVDTAAFSVTRSTPHGTVSVVSFYRRGDGIEIEGKGLLAQVSFTGTVSLGDDGRCRLQVDGQPLDEWQVLRRALETLFFGEAK